MYPNSISTANDKFYKTVPRKLIEYQRAVNTEPAYKYVEEELKSEFLETYDMGIGKSKVRVCRLLHHNELVFPNLLFCDYGDGVTQAEYMEKDKYAVVRVLAEDEMVMIDSTVTSAYAAKPKKTVCALYCLADLHENKLVYVGGKEYEFKRINNILLDYKNSTMKFLPDQNIKPVEFDGNIRIGGITKDKYVYVLVGGYDCECDRVCVVNSMTGLIEYR